MFVEHTEGCVKHMRVEHTEGCGEGHPEMRLRCNTECTSNECSDDAP